MKDALGGIRKGRCGAGERSTSYRAELYALKRALDDIIDGNDEEGNRIALPIRGNAEVRIALDSQSAIK